MLISLSDISTTQEKIEHILAPISLETFNCQGKTYEFVDKELVDITITNRGRKKVLVEAKVNLSLALFCGRCLERVVYPMAINVSKSIDLNLTKEERIKNLDEMNYIDGYNLDVDILIYEEILIDFPMKILCSKDCHGFCKSCGANLNNKSCDCDKTDYDPRMLAIRDIFNDFKEV